MTARYGTTKLSTIKRDFDRLRAAIQRHDPEATEAAWLDCERWVDFVMAKGVESNWQPRETAPYDGTEVVVYANGRVTTAWFCAETGLWPHGEAYNNDGEACNVGWITHWQPMLEPPK
jgi:hypothetical protein